MLVDAQPKLLTETKSVIEAAKTGKYVCVCVCVYNVCACVCIMCVCVCVCVLIHNGHISYIFSQAMSEFSVERLISHLKLQFLAGKVKTSAIIRFIMFVCQ